MGRSGFDRTPPAATPRSLPVGTVTFLRTDVEGSMRLMQALGAAWDAVNSEHLALIAGEVAAHGGVIVRTEGDALFAAFPEAGAGVAAAVAAQRALADHPWPAEGPVLVRMGLHTGEAHAAGDDYGGFDVNRAARIAAVGHGGQVILSGTTAALVADRLPSGCALRELGRYVLRDLARPEEIVQVDVAGLPTDFPPLRAGRATIGNLPERSTSFIGREREIVRIIGLLESARLITLTGPGGIGKSSLAVELARRVANDYPDGAWFVPLDLITDATLVDVAIARAIGLRDGPDRSAASALPGFLAHRHMLLVIDNFEHVVDAAPTISELLAAAGGIRLIVTSRTALRLTGEQEFPVAPLGGAGSDDAAQRLFIDRVRLVRPEWDPGGDIELIGDICDRLDGLPLGIELAAARVPVMPLRAIRDRIATRLPLPGPGRRDAPERQRTLEGAVAWSHDLLEPRLQSVLHDLAVFDGSFGVDEAAQVTDRGEFTSRDVLDHLVALVDQSLLGTAHDASEPRYGCLNVIRTFAVDRLVAEGAETATRRRHASAYLALADGERLAMGTKHQRRALDRMRVDAPNLHGALRWAIDADAADIAQPLVWTSWRFWQLDGRVNEGRELAERAMAMPSGQGATQARMWAAAAAGSLAYWQASIVEARRWYEEQARLADVLGDKAGSADAAFNLLHIVTIEGTDPGEAGRLADQAAKDYASLGDERGLARLRYVRHGPYGGGTATVEEITSLRSEFERLDDAAYHALTAAYLAGVLFRRGETKAASIWISVAIRETRDLGDVGSATLGLTGGTVIALVAKRHEDGARLVGAIRALSERYGVRPPASFPGFFGLSDPIVALREGLSTDRWDAAYTEGMSLSLDEAVDILLELVADAEAQAGDALTTS